MSSTTVRAVEDVVQLPTVLPTPPADPPAAVPTAVPADEVDGPGELDGLDGREDLVVEHLPLARSLAGRYRDRGEPVDDLVQVACLGLVKAARGFRPGAGPSFSAYAVPTITGELRRHFRDHGWDVRPPRRLQELRARLLSAERELEQELDAAPGEEELAERVGASVADVRAARAASAAYSCVSIDVPLGDSDGDPTLGDQLVDESDDIAAVVDSASLAPLLARLRPRDQRILALRFYRDATQSQIAAELGITQMQVSRLLSAALASLRDSLTADDGTAATGDDAAVRPARGRGTEHGALPRAS
ncbi:SigB/SigF/SigG family RNA polymerase sigma factor [Kineococcus terrestris]|uniref:SigB/SigF/SigG family RNA polymerase sigma factor n=1 Tax=Kineococcus terrestris TaxID=2044856 RepID=UPI0034DAF912